MESNDNATDWNVTKDDRRLSNQSPCELIIYFYGYDGMDKW